MFAAFNQAAIATAPPNADATVRPTPQAAERTEGNRVLLHLAEMVGSTETINEKKTLYGGQEVDMHDTDFTDQELEAMKSLYFSPVAAACF